MSILVATSFSKLSNNAVLYAAALAKQFNSKLVLFNAFKLPVHASNTLLSVASLDSYLENNKKKLKETASDLSKKFNISVEYTCSFSNLEDEVDVLMKLHNARFLVIGMSPKSMELNLLGNPTTTLISMKNFPVLAIPIHAKFNGINHILFACDILQDIPLKTLAKIYCVVPNGQTVLWACPPSQAQYLWYL